MMNKSDNSSDDGAKSEKYSLDQLYFYLTEGCNLACRHCWLAPKFDPDGNKYKTLPLHLFRKIIEEAIPLGLQTVKLTGGEPLLHPNFLAMLDILHDKSLKLTVETNGILLTPEIAGEIARQINPFVSVSLDGADAETHDKIRGLEGAFDKSTAGVQILADNDLKPQVIMSVMRTNADQAEKLVHLAEKLGAASVKFNIIQPTGRGEAIQGGSNEMSIKDIIELGRKVESDLAAKTKLQLFFDYPAAFQTLRNIATGDNCGVCGILSILGVLPSGHYALCGIGSIEKDLVFGRAGEDALSKVWEKHGILQKLRSELPDGLTGICSRCLMKHTCLGSCLAQNYYRKGSLLAPFWFCEQADAAGLFPDSRLDLAFNNP